MRRPRAEMLDLIVIDGQTRGIVARNLVTGNLDVHLADAVILARGGYGNVYYLSTNAKESNVRELAATQARSTVRQSLLYTDSSHPHSGLRRSP